MTALVRVILKSTIASALTIVSTIASTPAHADDVSYALDDTRPEGVWLSADVAAGGVAGDVVLAPSFGAGFETEPFALHVRAPIALRVWDLPPLAAAAGLPAGCERVRCEEWIDEDGALSPVALSRLVSEARLFHAGDVFFARAGGLLLTLGHGEVVRRYTNAAEWDRRRSGVYVEANLPWGQTQVQAFSASALYPVDLFGARLSVAPLFDAHADGVVARLLSRLRVGVEGAGDVLTPAAGVGLSPGTRPVMASAVDVTWPLLDEPGALQVAPFLSGSVVRGLSGAETFPALGGAAGLDASLDLIVVALRTGARLTVHQVGHRSAPFSTLWDVDRRRMIASSSSSRALLPVGAAEVPNPGGAGGALDAEVLVLRTVRALARLSLSPTLEANEAEVGLDVGAGGVRFGARLLERAFVTPLDVIAWNERTFFVLEATWALLPPLSFFARAQHALRFHGDGRGLSADDDVLVGISFDLVLSSS